jgi:hypothetical protein
LTHLFGNQRAGQYKKSVIKVRLVTQITLPIDQPLFSVTRRDMEFSNPKNYPLPTQMRIPMTGDIKNEVALLREAFLYVEASRE